MMAIQTAYQAYNELHPPNEEPHRDDEEKGGIIHDIKESVKEVVHQITGKDDSQDTLNLVENEISPAPMDDEEVPEFSKTGYINPAMHLFTPQDAADESEISIHQPPVLKHPPRRISKTHRDILVNDGDDIIEIKVVPATQVIHPPVSEEAQLVDAGKHIEVHCDPRKVESK